MFFVCSHNTCLRRGNKHGFALLEVILSVMILSIALTTLMRSFTICMNVIRRNDIVTQGCILAEALMQDLESTPPESRRQTGTFENDGFPEYSYVIQYEEEIPKYRNLPKGVKLENPVPVRSVNVKVYYTRKDNQKVSTITSLDLILPPLERWKYESKFLNGLFYESPRSTGRRR